MTNIEDRHPSVQHLLTTFEYDHLPPRLEEISKQFHDLAWGMALQLADGAELVAGLRKLREAKDCFVIQRLLDDRPGQQ